MMIGPPLRNSAAPEEPGEDSPATLALDDALDEPRASLLDEVGGPVPDFLRAAQVLRSATDDIKEQLNAPEPARPARRSGRKPLGSLKEDEGARLRRLLSNMANMTPAEPSAEKYRPAHWDGESVLPRFSAQRMLQALGEWIAGGRLLGALRSAPVVTTVLLLLFGVVGAVGYVSVLGGANARPVDGAPNVTASADATSSRTAVATRTALASSVATASVGTSSPGAVSGKVTIATAAAAPAAVLRPSRPAAALALPTPPPLEIPLEAVEQPRSEVAATAPDPVARESDPEVAVVDGDALNVRAGPSRDSAKLFALSRNERVAVLEVADDWIRVRDSDERIGWVFSTLSETAPKTLRPGADTESEQASAAIEPTHAVKSGGVTVRSGPAKRNRALFNLSSGERVTALEEKDGWTRIKAPDGKVGWAYGEYLVPSR